MVYDIAYYYILLHMEYLKFSSSQLQQLMCAGC